MSRYVTEWCRHCQSNETGKWVGNRLYCLNRDHLMRFKYKPAVKKQVVKVQPKTTMGTQLELF